MSTDEPTKVCCDSIDLRIENGWLTEVHNHCTCGGSGIPSPAHLPGCGLVPLVPLADIIGMAEHDRQVAEQAWDEAVNASVLHYEPPSGLYSGVSWPANPYRRALAADEGEAVTHDLRRALAAARPAPTVSAADVEITTAAELDALPAGTIVRDRFGGYLAQGRDAMGVAWFHYPDYDHAGSSALVAGIGPVTVCFTPGLTVADEGAER